jgi:hypothetical protein
MIRCAIMFFLALVIIFQKGRIDGLEMSLDVAQEAANAPTNTVNRLLLDQDTRRIMCKDHSFKPMKGGV